MTLTEGIAEIRDGFQQYETDGIAFAEYDLCGHRLQNRKIHRITDVFVRPNDVLLLIDPLPSEQVAAAHMTVQELLARLIALPPECGQYSLEACEPEIVIPEEDARMRFDYPIVAIARVDRLQLCLLVHVDSGSEQARKKRDGRKALLFLPSVVGVSLFLQSALNLGSLYFLAMVPLLFVVGFGYLTLYEWLAPAEPPNLRAKFVSGVFIVGFQIVFWVVLFIASNWWRGKNGT